MGGSFCEADTSLWTLPPPQDHGNSTLFPRTLSKDQFTGIGERKGLRIVFLAYWPASPHCRRVPPPIRAEPCLGRTKPERTVLPGRAPTSRARRRQSALVFANDAAPGMYSAQVNQDRTTAQTRLNPPSAPSCLLLAIRTLLLLLCTNMRHCNLP